MSHAPKPKRRWYQYSLRTLLALMAVLSIGMSWFAGRVQRANRQRAAVEAIEKLGGLVLYDYQVDASGAILGGALSQPGWLRSLAGDDLLRSVALVDLRSGSRPGVSGGKVSQVCDDDIQSLKALAELRFLYLGGTQITDDGLQSLEGLTQLRELFLDSTQITDAGLKHLLGLKRLETLCLARTAVTDAGLQELKRLSALRSIDASGTQVSGANDQQSRVQGLLVK